MADKNFTPVDALIGKSGKESEPVMTPVENSFIQEVVEHRPEKEMSPFISSRATTITLPPDIKKLGVSSATTNSNFSNYQNVRLPISDDRVLVGLHAPLDSSLRWLATLAIYILQQAHLGLKKVHGRVIRVVKK